MNHLKKLVPQFVKNFYHLVQAVAANIQYGFPGRRLKVIGITGTNGKTTTTQLITKILEEAGHKVAMASTINFKLGDKEWVNTSKYTTLSSFQVQKFLRQAVAARCEYAVLETSSHALDQYRVWGVPYTAAVITNVTREHLDYHHTMAKYRKAKKRLFAQARIAIVNRDMESPEEFLEGEHDRRLAYSLLDSRAEVLAHKLMAGLEGSTFEVDGQAFTLHLPGLFNVENALAAIATGLSQNISLETMSQALAKVQRVPGRMEEVPNSLGIKILIDYAVTPDSLEKLYSLIHQMKPSEASKIIAVFGACGERDRGKRPIMGEIVSSYADYIILTNEDPYHEDPRRIVREIRLGIHNKTPQTNLWVIMDRRKAIQKALKLAQPGDVVVVTGKGAEETMAIGDERLSWNDRKVIEEILG
jgi:UDP-N-acetylmuramoyl-L-alanyl-D-glutamate--2,6-diaminopimelate ligase